MALHLPKPRTNSHFERVVLDGQEFRIDVGIVGGLAKMVAPLVQERISQLQGVSVTASFDGGQDDSFQMGGLPILFEWLTKLEVARFEKALASGEYAVAGAILEQVVRTMEEDSDAVHLQSGWPSGAELVTLLSIVDVIYLA